MALLCVVITKLFLQVRNKIKLVDKNNVVFCDGQFLNISLLKQD